ncbi:immunoglobulin-like domain-containing protein, partial [Aliarcobacter butzleri]
HNGGKYEAVTYDNATYNNPVTVIDDNDATTITIKSPENVDENATKVTYTLEVDNAPQTDLIVTVTVNGVDREVTILKDTKSVTFDVD